MSLTETLLHGRMLTALAVYALSSAAWLLAGARLSRRLQATALGWWWERIMSPLGHAALVAVFVALAYPVLFGVASAPPLGAVIAHHRLSVILYALFFGSLLLEMVPRFGKRAGLLMPMQAVLAASILFAWAAPAAGTSEVRYWPGGSVVASALLTAVVMHTLAVWLADRAGNGIDRAFDLHGAPVLVYHALTPFLQAPVILLLTLPLGHQLAD